jgi:hypothetical protein
MKTTQRRILMEELVYLVNVDEENKQVHSDNEEDHEYFYKLWEEDRL